MARCSTALLLTVGAMAGLPAAAAADENTPCTAARPQPQIALAERGGGTTLYATHELKLTVSQAGEDGVAVRSVAAPGARTDAQDADETPSALWVDRPGPVTVTVRTADRDPAVGSGSAGECTHTVSRTFTITPAAITRAGKLKRPFLVDRRRRLWYRRVSYTFAVKPSGPAADLSPLTVRARTTRRARYPSARARAFSQTFGLRAFDTTEPPFRRGCNDLICPPRARNGSAKAVGVLADERSGRLRIQAIVPTAYPSRSGRRVIPTPWGVDIQVFQSGGRVARLRAAGRCTDGGQAARCTFKRVSTKP